MMGKLIEKNKVPAMIITIISMCFLMGISFATYYWKFVKEQTTVTTRTVSISMLETFDEIEIKNASPISDEEGKALKHEDNNTGVFDFAVTTYAKDAPKKINYTISVTKLETGTTTQLQDSQIKAYLVAFDESTETQVMAPTTLDNIITSGDTGTLVFDKEKKDYQTHIHTIANTSQTQKYRLKIWIDSNTNTSNWNSNTTLQYKLKINADEQLA